MALPHVYILTWCKRIELLYGTTLVFHTLRAGFPSAPLHVVDAASLVSVQGDIRSQAESCGAQFVQLDRRVELSFFIEQVLAQQSEGSAVFVDPDVCFWEPVEKWEFSSLAAGRFIPRHHCEFSGCVSEPRLHTSLFWIPDVARLRTTIARIRESRRYFEPFRNMMLRMDHRWVYFDTGAGLYGACRDQMDSFDTHHLNSYDHLFAGTYADSVLSKLASEMGAVYRDIHLKAQRDYRLIKGCWRQQEGYFRNRQSV